MPCCCVTGCHNRAEKGHKLYKLPQGHRNETRRKLWIQNIGRKGKLPLNAYVCRAHFTDDQFELKRADHKKLLKWNAVPTIFSHSRTIKRESPSEQKAAVLTRHETSDSPKKATAEESLKTEFIIKTEVEESCKDNSDEVLALKCKLNASLKEIHTLRTTIFQLQAIIEKLVEKNCMDKT
ncbi:THAP domain-containing protein 4-like [Temnothorax curvispinosus]|uniref:THAP domain-containing protein 4-like n=1 Tax=Temnothorax curvispinosus TaxID=300111 RepID=A0A6J1R2X0_9HYME|nr:THAP domain-containing protein 4-like [Temnothorax curvispinosus]XP_024888474.1 THAP domain-containing protein 4-like [Temnothorax curvispinosus]XP_024888475.1 THAP domain-containing protein 4-like [Temnothorax curvispinosus]